MFYKELINVIENKDYDKIVLNDFLIWHFLHNQKDDLLFLEIKQHIIPVIIEDKENKETGLDGGNKWKLIEYFIKYGDNHTNDIISVLLDMYNKARTLNIKRRIAMCIENLKISNNDINLLFDLSKQIITETDPMVRDFASRSLCNFVDEFSLKQNEELIQSMFFTKTEEKDVIQETLSMSVRFQAKDLSDSSFRESARFIGLVLQNTKFTIGILPEFMKIYDYIISQDLVDQEDSNKIKYHSTRRLNRDDLNKLKIEHESDPKKRLLLELWNALVQLENKNQPLFIDVCNKIIENAEYVGYFEILAHVLEDKNYPGIIKQIVMNPDIIIGVDLNKQRWYKMFNEYLRDHKDEIDDFVEKVESISIKDNENLQRHIKAETYYAIPEPRPTKAQEFIDNYQKEVAKENDLDEWKISVRNDSDFSVRTYWEDDKKIDEEWFTKKRTQDELIAKIVEHHKSDKTLFHGDQIFKKYNEYFQNHQDQLEEFYTEIKENHPELLKKRFGSYLSQGQIDRYKEIFSTDKDLFYQKMIELYDLFSDDNQAKLNIARAIESNEYLRAKDTGKMKENHPELFEKVKSLVLKIANDDDPVNEEEQSLSIALNSVRGEGVRLVSVLSYYYWGDKELLDQLRKLSNDPLMGIKATVVENLVYLIVNNYAFCEEIISKFEDIRDPQIDNALIRYMFRLGNIKIKEKSYLFEKIAQNNDNDVSHNLGALIGQAFTHKADLDSIVDKMIEGTLGDVNVVESFANQLENEIPNILLINDRRDIIDKVLSYYNKLLTEYSKDDIENHNKVANRLSFLFYDQKLPTKDFDVFEKNKVFQTIIENGELSGQSNLNKYLLRCLEENKESEKVLKLIKQQIEKYEPILADEYHSKDISDIIRSVIKFEGRNELVDEIFDKGLMYGGSEFYKIFDEYYKDSR